MKKEIDRKMVRSLAMTFCCLVGLFTFSLCSSADISTGTSLNNILVSHWNYTFGNVYGGFYRMIPGPSAAIGDFRTDQPGLEIATGNEEYVPLGCDGNLCPLGRCFGPGRILTTATFYPRRLQCA
ncbi:MAG: hypothetical protein HY747_08770 [Elusimicrobia bacterium]|nr:hypothetical protein [Elusimicrobiota bacterium]